MNLFLEDKVISISDSRTEERRFFGFKLDQTSTVVLFILAITFLIGSISRIYDIFVDFFWTFPEPQIDELVFLIITVILFLIPLAIWIFTLFSCLKKRNNHVNNENNEMNWFGFGLNGTSATILFTMSLIGIVFFGIGVYGITSIFIFYSLRTLDLIFIFNTLIPHILISIGVIIIFLIDVYTMRRCLPILKKAKKEKKFSTSENNNKTKIFGFELNETSGSIIFIYSLVGILSFTSLITFYIFNFALTTAPYDLFSNLLFSLFQLFL